MKFKAILVFLVYVLLSLFVISLTPYSDAIIYDAKTYLVEAQRMVDQGIIRSFLSTGKNFSDRGYPLILSLIISVFGSNIFVLQLFNYTFWALSSWLIYQSLKKLQVKSSIFTGLLMLFSPLYLTFSAKLYSESYATLGTSLLIYSFVTLYKSSSNRTYVALFLGSFIFFGTKSVFLLLIIPFLAILLYTRKFKAIITLFISLFLLTPSIIGAGGGGRGLYNLAIQASKTEGTYSEILACFPYYLSYPVGQKLLPSYEGVCHQNDPSLDMPRAGSNPYTRAGIKREQGYGYGDWLGEIVKSPVKYLAVVLTSMGNIVFFEGIYPTILLKFPSLIIAALYLLTKISLSIYLWSKSIMVLYRVRKNFKLLALLSLPLLYFVIVVGNFPIEPRYFYPLVPYIYFLSSLEYGKYDRKNN